MKLLLVLFLCVNFGHAQEAGEGGGDGGDASFVHPDQFLSMLVNGKFKCGDMCSAQPAFVGYQQSEFAAQLNIQWIHHMEHKLNQWGYELKPPPPIFVNVFDQPYGGDRKDDNNAQSKLNQEMTIARPYELDSKLLKHSHPRYDHAAHVFAMSLEATLRDMNTVLSINEVIGFTERNTAFDDIPKITTKQDMMDARKKTEDNESDVYFIFFHNEANPRNKHVTPFVKLKDKYSHMADFYRTDTGFALIWAELLDIYRMFDTLVAVHPQGGYVVLNHYPAITEKMTMLPEDYQYLDAFVQLTHGTFNNFARIHLGFEVQVLETNSIFPHVSVN